MNTPALYCRTHDGYYRPPRCSPLCTLLTSWSEPSRAQAIESSERDRLAQESGDLCKEAAMRFGMHPKA